MEQAIAENNMSIEVQELIRQAEAIAATGKPDQAIEKLDAAEKMDKKVVKIYLDKAVIYIMMSNLDMAEKELAKAKIIDDSQGAIYYQEGNVAYLNHDINKAKASYSKAIELGFETNNVYLHLANCLAEQKEIDAALYYYGKAEQQAPYEGRATVKKIQLCIQAGDYQKALYNAKYLIEIKPEAFEGYHYKFMALLAMNKPEEAKQTLDRAIDMFSDDLGFKYDLMMYYDQVQMYNEAIDVIDNYFLSRNDDGEWNHLIKDKANLLFKAKRFDEVEQVASSILKTEHDDRMAYYMMFKKLTDADYDGAIYYAREIKNHKDNAEDLVPYYAAVYYEALAFLKKEDTEKANALFNAAVVEFRSECVKQPRNVNLYVYRCVAYKALKDYGKALDAANYIITLTNGEFIEGYLLRSMIYEDMNEKEKAAADRKVVEASNKPILNFLT